ncbi:MAG: NAD(P)H-dependent oxidoreductase [Pedosphaera sp.]|nr:NAD(P)H-dependent oxidoreductase [Pedosphaera sp.]
MSVHSPDSVLEQLRWRYATKQFDASRKIDPSLWNDLEQALILAPSSFGLQPWRFIVITSPDIRAALLSKSWGQKQVVDCSHFVVLTVKIGLDQAHVDRFLERQIALRGGSLETLATYRGMILSSLKGAAQAGRLDTWQTHQIYIALGQFMTTAAMLGIDTCPMEGIDPTAYDQILGLDDSSYRTVVACAVGFRSPNDTYASLPKVRFSGEELIQHL